MEGVDQHWLQVVVWERMGVGGSRVQEEIGCPLRAVGKFVQGTGAA